MATPHSASDQSHGPAPTPVARLLALLAQERGEIWLVYLYASVAGLLSLTLPLGMQAIIGLVGGGLVLQPVVILIAAVVLGTAAGGLLQVLQLSAAERMQQRIFARLALDWGSRIPRLSIEGTVGEYLPETVNRFFEIVIIQKSLSKLLTEAVGAALAIVFGLILLTLYHPLFFIAGFALFTVLAAILWFTGRDGLKTSLEESAAKYRVAHWLQIVAGRLSTFRLAESSMPLSRTDAEVADYLRARQSHFRVLVRQSVSAVLFKTIITGALLVLGTLLVVDRQITLGQFVASELVVVSLLTGVEKLILSLSTVYDVLTASEKSSHVGDLPLEPHYPGVALTPTGAGMAVVAEGLSYRYPGATQYALQNISIRVAPGERIALTGTEGAGETTMFSVLAGLLPSFEGALSFDGISVRDLDRTALRQQIGVVEHAPFLFEGTIADNIVVGRPHITEADLRAAIEIAGLHDFIATQPEGMRTVVGGSTRLPSHVERKISLARAVAGRPALLLLDEFFHHLEPVLKRDVLRRLCGSEREWTVIAVSHDPVYLAQCDRIYVMLDGTIAREGTFEELLGDAKFAAQIRAHGDRLISAP